MPKNQETTKTVERMTGGASEHSQVTVSGKPVPRQTPTDKSANAATKAKAMDKEKQLRFGGGITSLVKQSLSLMSLESKDARVPLVKMV